MRSSKPDLKAVDLVKMLRDKYQDKDTDLYNRHVVLEEVANATGTPGRWVDVVVISMWRMDNLTRAAYEIKVSRQDLLRELSNPEKYEWCMDCFHEFWYVMPKDILVSVDELPKGVGWLYPRGNILCVGKQAKRNPKPRLDDLLLASFMRSAWKEIRRSQTDDIKNLLANNEDYKLAEYYREGSIRFLKERKKTFHGFDIKSPDDVYNALQGATMDNQLREDRDHFLELIGHFQREILSLLNVYLVLAKKSLLVRDQYGSHVVNTYGGLDRGSVKELRKLLKDRRYKDLRGKINFKILEAFEEMM